MAAYNRADLIGTAITSVLEQDFDDYELVIVDDGSTDGTPDVVQSFADSRIRTSDQPGRIETVTYESLDHFLAKYDMLQESLILQRDEGLSF